MLGSPMALRRLPLIEERALSSASTARDALASNLRDSVFGKLQGPACRKGCASCCYLPVSASIMEALSLYRWLVTHSLWSHSLEAKLKEHSAATSNLPLETWALMGLACPLLTEEKSCMAYPARPFYCSTLWRVGDSYDCQPSRIQADTFVDRSEAARAYRAAEAKEVTALGAYQDLTLPLSLALLAAKRVDDGVLSLTEFFKIFRNV